MESINLKSVFSTQFYEVLVLNIPMSSALTSTTYFVNDLTPGGVHSSKFVLLKQPHHWEKLLFNLQSQKGCSSAGTSSLCHPACALLQLPTLLSLLLLPAQVAWLECAWEAVSRHFSLLEVSRGNSSVLAAQSVAAEGSPLTQHQMHWRIFPLFSEKVLDTWWTDELSWVYSK